MWDHYKSVAQSDGPFYVWSLKKCGILINEMHLSLKY
jgi:hypothetical protein